MEYTKFVGFDTRKDTAAVAVAKDAGGDFLGAIPITPEAIAKLIRRLAKDTGTAAAPAPDPDVRFGNSSI